MCATLHQSYFECGYAIELFDQQFVDHALYDMVSCLICTNVLRDPVECQGCKVHICWPCVKKMYKSNIDKCPHCRLIDGFKSDAFMKRYLDNLPVQCPEGSCTWKGPLQQWHMHLKECQYALYTCQYSECKEKILASDREAHMKSCECRVIDCPECAESVQFKNLSYHLNNVCLVKSLICPNQCYEKAYARLALRGRKRKKVDVWICLQTNEVSTGPPEVFPNLENKFKRWIQLQPEIHRVDLQHHLTYDCPEQLVQCTFESCSHTCPRRELAGHMFSPPWQIYHSYRMLGNIRPLNVVGLLKNLGLTCKHCSKVIAVHGYKCQTCRDHIYICESCIGDQHHDQNHRLLTIL